MSGGRERASVRACVQIILKYHVTGIVRWVRVRGGERVRGDELVTCLVYLFFFFLLCTVCTVRYTLLCVLNSTRTLFTPHFFV